ncbi:MerR family transcriptional regulator [Clostridium sp. D2Q-14]|uniref:MerR family transcriptional regulator n=1 Tax=Anaeromonas gelatinilytica TaxID=2683194 RepID=UPI00193B9695|nr:MerR family transcriptional regulator [Anaeromonas gelatinilytica]MBS4535317.1 MerR family transcriptional regulator [Anaeromonas gelatinilytica]
MKKTFSTGELAKLCNVSTRTVQYYDKKGIIKPSELSEGGRRIYSEDDLNRFRCICLYKALGFTLNEIKTLAGSENTYDLLYDTILNQQEKIHEDIQALQQTKERLNAILEQIKETGKVNVESIEEMDDLLVKKNHHKKTDIMTYIFLGCYALLLIVGFKVAFSMGGIIKIIMLGISLILLIGLIYYHSEVNAYVCPNCHEKFSISFLKDLISPNGTINSKYLKCSNCGHKGWFKDTFRD